jgi:Tripartite tricarboxylate transporter family receptor.
VTGLQVPYRGSGQMMPNLLAGRVQVASLEIIRMNAPRMDQQ